MREQSSSNIKNTHKVFRGGETKVMKKSLVSLLVFALVFTMVAPAFAQVNDIGNSYAKEEIEALIEAGIIGGYEDGTFKPANAITRAEFAKILALSLELEENAAAANVFTDVPAWAKGYVGALVEAELTTGLTATTYGSSQNITREQLATFFVRAFGYEEAAEELDLTPSFNDAANVAPYAKANVAFASEIGFINGLPNGNFDPKGNAQRQAVARLAYEFYFNADEYHAAAEELIEANEPAPDHATKVEKVYADNLLQVKVEFDGKVDSLTATEQDNYTLVGGDSPKVESASVVNENTVVLTLEKEKPFRNQEEYKLSFTNVRSGDNSTVLSVNGYAFTPVDSTLPTVESVEALGNKTLRVKFNEPVKTANVNNFKVDDKLVAGHVSIVKETVVVKLANTLEDGSYTLTVEGVTDFANFKSLKQDFEFNVVKDTEAPTVLEVVNATFEYVTLQFSEPIDPDSVVASNIYWVQGSTKKYANSFDHLSDDTFRFNFNTADRLQYATELHVTGVKDYSGNTIAADTKVSVSPVIDQTRPEVVNATLDDTKNITVKFNKNLDKDSAEKAANYVIKDADGKEVSRLKFPVLQSDSKTVKIELASSLTAGRTYTLEISGVSDNTTLKNVMLPYSKELKADDKVGPEVLGITVNDANRTIVVSYDKQMATSGDGSILEGSKYVYSTNVDGSDLKRLPAGAYLNTSADNKSAIIYFPSNTSSFKFEDIAYLEVSLVKDSNGNWLKGLKHGEVVTEAKNPEVTGAVYATDKNKIEVKFDKSLVSTSVNANDFVVTAGSATLSIIKAELKNSTTVVLTLSDNTKLDSDATYNNVDVEVSVKANARTESADGKNIKEVTGKLVEDAIAPSVKSVQSPRDGETITITFDEVLGTHFSTANIATDLVIKKGSKTFLPSEYDVEVVGSSIVVTFTTEQSGVISVAVPNPRFITDSEGNVANLSDAIEVLIK